MKTRQLKRVVANAVKHANFGTTLSSVTPRTAPTSRASTIRSVNRSKTSTQAISLEAQGETRIQVARRGRPLIKRSLPNENPQQAHSACLRPWTPVRKDVMERLATSKCLRALREARFCFVHRNSDDNENTALNQFPIHTFYRQGRSMLQKLSYPRWIL